MDALNRRQVLAGTAALGAATVLGGSHAALAQDATPATSPIPMASPVAEQGGDWAFYGHDVTGAKATTGAGVTSASVASLAPLWQVETQGAVSSTPVIAGGVAYVGSYDGNLYAVDLLSGEAVWTYATGSAVLEPNLQIPLGITGSAGVAGEVVYVGDATATLHAVDRATGEAVWTAKLDEQENASIWSSPVVLDGVVYLGVASVAKQEGFRGSVVAVDAADGALLWQTYMVPEGADGAGVFAVPAIDVDRGMLYVGTQNAYSESPAPYGDPLSVVALNVATGERLWAFASPEHDGETAPVDDVGFSASPNLFSAKIDGTSRELVGVGQKSGVYWALDRDSGEAVWMTRISPAGLLGGMEGTSAYADGVVAVPATDWPEFDGPAAGLVSGVDAATGEVLWTAEESAPVASPVAISVDVVFQAGFDGVIHAYGLADGAELWSADLGASVSGGIGVADGVVVLGAATPLFAPFILPGNTIRAFGLSASGGTPAATPDAAPQASPVASRDGRLVG